jgi:thymidylate synthase ThyX
MSFDQLKVELCDIWGSDKNVAHSAWASTYDAEKLAAKTDAEIRRVVSDVVTHDHGTPKERMWMEWFITCPIFIERQFDKYRMSVQFQDLIVDFYMAPMGREMITQNELSGRYRTFPDRPYVLPLDVADIVARSVNDSLGLDEGLSGFSVRDDFEELMKQQREFYENTLQALRHARDKSKSITGAEFKRAREVIRGVLGTSYLTDMRILCNLSSFEWIITQRIAPESQLESRVVAAKMLLLALAQPSMQTSIQKMVEVNGWQEQLDELMPLLEEKPDEECERNVLYLR